jgi:hypothetical protein
VFAWDMLRWQQLAFSAHGLGGGLVLTFDQPSTLFTFAAWEMGAIQFPALRRQQNGRVIGD